MSASYIRFNTGEISLSQLKHLLAVYYGEEQCDLGTDIPAHFSRKKSASSSSDLNGQAFITQVEALIAEMESQQINPNQSIPMVSKRKLIQLMNDDNMKPGPEFSFRRRIATHLQLGMKPEIHTEIRVIVPVLKTIVMAICLRATLGTPYFGFTLLSNLVIGILDYLNSQKMIEPVKTADDKQSVPLSDDPQFLPLVTQSEEFARALRLPAVPRLYLGRKSATTKMPTPQVPAGEIEFNNYLLKNLDFEEQKAVLAHEMGHLHSFFKSNNARLEATSSTIVAFAAATASKMASVLLNNFGFKKLIPFEAAVIISLSLFWEKMVLQREEIYADNIAKKLAGPLADASAHRTGHRFFHSKPTADFLGRHYYLAKFLEVTGLNDAFSYHPVTKKRM